MAEGLLSAFTDPNAVLGSPPTTDVVPALLEPVLLWRRASAAPAPTAAATRTQITTTSHHRDPRRRGLVPPAGAGGYRVARSGYCWDGPAYCPPTAAPDPEAPE